MGAQGGKNTKGRQLSKKRSNVNSVNRFIDNITCFYTNADQFPNKFSEFQTRIRDTKPKVIGITEVKAKNYKQNQAEYTMEWVDEYNMFSINIDNDTRRGMLLYVHKTLSASEVKLITEFQENVFVEIATNQRETMLVGLTYRSESGTEENNRNLRSIIDEANNKKCTHCIIMGDFNYPGIDWDTYSTKGENSDEHMFIECLQDNYMFQTINKPTRRRGTNKPNILDLIVTQDENCISEIEYQTPLGKSDHCVITFKYTCCVCPKIINKERRRYNKANYQAIREDLSKFDRHTYLNEDDINNNWKIFRIKINEIENKHIPIVKIKGGKKGNQIPLNKDILLKIKEKKSLSRKLENSHDKTIRVKYNRIRNQVLKLVRKAKKNYERSLSEEAKINPKRIWQYINSKSKSKQGIGDLFIDPNNPKSEKNK